MNMKNNPWNFKKHQNNENNPWKMKIIGGKLKTVDGN